MEVTIHHEHHHGMEARLRKKLQLVQTALRLDRDVLDEMRGEISGFRSAFARTKALALERAATLEAENAQRFALSEVTAAGARRDVEIVRAEADAARDAATNATKARAAGEAAFAAMRAAARAQAVSGAADLDAARADADEAHASAARRYNDVAAAKVREIEQRAEGAAREAAALRAAVAGAEARASSAENERRRAVEDAAEAVQLKARLEDAKNAADAACGAAASSASAAANASSALETSINAELQAARAARDAAEARATEALASAHAYGKRAVDAETSVADAVQRASEAEARLKALEEAMTGMSETGQAELAKLKSRLNDERKKSMTLVAENDAARDENEKLAEALAATHEERRQDAVNLKKLAEGLVQATAEKERLTELLKVAASEQARLSSEMEALRRAPPLPAPSCDESALREQIANLERHVHRQAEERVELLARLEERRDAPPPIMANVGNLPAISQSLPEDHAMKFIQRSRKAKATAQRRHQARRV